jgi:uncharacterized protein
MPPVEPPPIKGVPTAVTAFIGRTIDGPVEKPTSVASLTQFQSLFGALSAECPLTTSVEQFFVNGGTEAIIVRLDNGGQALTAANFIEPALETQNRGIWTLGRIPHFNLIVIPPLAPGVDVPVPVWNTVITLAAARRAFVLVDPPLAWTTAQDAIAGVDAFITRSLHAALYFPRVLVSDPAHPGQTIATAPSGLIAGIYARTDNIRGVWKSPAGLDAHLVGAVALSVSLGTAALEALNKKAVNTLREIPGGSRVVWGARTLAGVNELASEWKYVSVRRLVDFIERSVIEGTQWAASEPNSQVLWQTLHGQVWDFLKGLWQSGGLQGSTSNEAFFVKCDQSTMTQDDIDSGRVIVMLGLAVMRRAEFTVVKVEVASIAP